MENKKDSSVEQLENFLKKEEIREEEISDDGKQLQILKRFEQIYFSIGSSKMNSSNRIKIIRDFYEFLKDKK